MELEDFLKVFGKWTLDIKSSDGQVKEFKIGELYKMLNKGVVLDTEETSKDIMTNGSGRI